MSLKNKNNSFEFFKYFMKFMKISKLKVLSCISSGIARICCEEGQRWKLCWLQGRVQQLLNDW